VKLHELQERRASAVSDMRAIAATVEAEQRDYSDDEDKRHKALKTELAGLDGKIARARDLAEAERAAPAIVQGHGDGRFEERARSFSITKALAAALGDGVDAAFEREISAEVQRRAGRKFQGIAVPDECFMERRTLLAGSSAADLIPNIHRGDLFIDRLRSALVVGRLGATVLDNLVGTIDIPKQTGSSTAQWVAEDGSLTETDATFTDVNLTPKTVGCMTSYSRRTLISAVPSIEQLVRRDLAEVIAHAIDAAALFGPGTGNMPTGIVATVGVTDLPLSSVTALATVAGTPDTSTVIFGAWSQLLIGYWSGTDILLNPYESTAYAKGRVMVRAMRDVDVAVRHPQSFAFGNDLAVGP
jgi:HK97 family phage major capsid protein